jgi:hypothetical protein
MPSRDEKIRQDLARRKRECWGSPWRGARRDGQTDLPRKYVRLNAVEMRHAALTGGVAISEREATRLGLIDPPELKMENIEPGEDVFLAGAMEVPR